MSLKNHFDVASKSEGVGLILFYVVTVASATLVLYPKPEIESWLHPLLVVAAFLAVGCTIVTNIYQTQGNHLLRAAQLSDALGATVGERIRVGYYNNPLSPSLQRLAVTTLENTFFSSKIVSIMLYKKRLKIVIYSCILLLLLTCRQSSTGWLLLLAQTLFSADLILSWLRMERFRYRINRVHDSLKQFFLQEGNIEKSNGMAIVLVAFTDYECAKDEAAFPFNSDLFDKMNPILSKQWEDIKVQLNIK